MRKILIAFAVIQIAFVSFVSHSFAKDSVTIGAGFSTEGWAEINGEDPDILVALETVVVLSN